MTTDNIAFKDCKTWQDKAMLISLFHTSKCIQHPNSWNMAKTAKHFNISIGMVSENIRLAKEFDGPNGDNIVACKTREDALKMIERRKYKRE